MPGHSRPFSTARGLDIRVLVTGGAGFIGSHVVGERCRRGVIWDFVHKLQRNPKELEILGNGRQSKEYLRVKDCVEGMMTGWRKSKGPVEAFNLGQPRQTLVDEVADIVIAEMKLEGVKRRYTGGSRGWIGDILAVHLDISKLKSCGWWPSLRLKKSSLKLRNGQRRIPYAGIFT